MDPNLILMAVNAAVRLGRAGQQAMAQYARDRDVLLPLVNKIQFPPRDIIGGYFTIHSDRISTELRPYWDSFTGKAPQLAGDFDVVAAEYARQQAIDDPKTRPLADDVAGMWMVTQWQSGERPAGPIARVVLTIVDVAAEFAAHDPRIFGVGSHGEALVKAFAVRVADFIPDDGDALGSRNLLGDRLTGIFLRAGLVALSEHPESIVDEKHLQSLVANTLPQLVNAFPQTLDRQVDWRNVVETLLGPVANEAVRAIAVNPQAFFGSRFADEDLLGTLTQTFLLKTAEVGLQEIFSRAGAIQIYKATLQLAAARPDLFIGMPGASEKFIAAVFQDLALTLEEHAPPLDHHLVAELAAVAIETVGREGSAMLDPAKPWHNIVSQTLTPVIGAVADALRASDTGALRRLGSHDNLQAMVRIVVNQVARTPGMVTGTDNIEVNRLVGAVAAAMARDEHLLLSHDDWMEVLTVAAEEVAANPGRLLGVLGSGASDSLLATLLVDLLDVAMTQWLKQERAGGTVLFGSTLREAMIIAIRASASQAADALLNSAKLKELAAQLAARVAANTGKYGSKEWLCLYRLLITQVIAAGAFATLDDATMDAALVAPGVH